MLTCSVCTDLSDETKAHECWVLLKLATQENLPEPQDTSPPEWRHGRVEWPDA